MASRAWFAANVGALVIVMGIVGCDGGASPDDAGSIDAIVRPDATMEPDSGLDSDDSATPHDATGSDDAPDAMIDASAVEDVGVDADCGCDDGVACTVDLCTALGCEHRVDYSACATGTYCDAMRGCIGATTCASAASCLVTDPCVVSSCDAATATCRYGLLDGDHDGANPIVCGGTDCNDADANIGPTRRDVCNGGDDDCDGATDEGTSCSNDYTCVSGTCRCLDTVCLGAPNYCADLQTSHTDCGACGQRCALEQTCLAGVCTCPADRPMRCGEACVDTTSDTNNCGACFVRCGTGSCVDGACTCPAPTTLCRPSSSSPSSICADLQNDAANCGRCGHGCLTGSECIAGACVADAAWLVGYGDYSSAQQIKDMDVSPAGDIYLVSSGRSDIIGGSTVAYPFAAATPGGVAHITADGVFARGLGLPDATGVNLAATENGYVLTTLGFSGAMTIAGTTLTCPSPVSRRCTALVALTPTNTIRWTRLFVGTSTTTSVAPRLADIQRFGTSVVVLGQMAVPYDLGGGSVPFTATDSTFALVLDDATGAFQSVVQMTGQGDALSVMEDGSFVVGGHYSGTLVIGDVTLPMSSSIGYYVARFAPDGSGHAARAVTAECTFDSFGRDIAVSSENPALFTVTDEVGAPLGTFSPPTPSSPFGTNWNDATVGFSDRAVAIGGAVVTPALGGRVLATFDETAALESVYYYEGAETSIHARALNDDEIILAGSATMMSISGLRLRSPTHSIFVTRVRLR